MTLRAAALAAIAFAGCTRQVELLPPLLCPAAIDVYGDDDTLFSACGGPAAVLPASGLFAPGRPDYDATLAGRLQAALAGDLELSRRFGVAFHVRACGSPGAALSSLAPGAVQDDECKAPDPDAPPLVVGASEACSDGPAPVLLLVASEPRDRCSGGGGTARPDDEARYAKHFAARLDALLAARKPGLVFIGPQTEWTPLPGARLEDAGACTWPRGDWARSALSTWRAAPSNMDRIVAGDLQPAFKRHSACCQTLGLPCEQPEWLARPTPMDPAPARVTCEGAGRIVAFWVAVVRSALANGQFECDE